MAMPGTAGPDAARSFVAPDPDYAARVRASFARQGAMGLIGARMVEGNVVKPGRTLVITRGEVCAAMPRPRARASCAPSCSRR